jgi:hypothetical protein
LIDAATTQAPGEGKKGERGRGVCRREGAWPGRAERMIMKEEMEEMGVGGEETTTRRESRRERGRRSSQVREKRRGGMGRRERKEAMGVDVSGNNIGRWSK